MSLKALVAAMAPKVYGSSTIGVKKSTVCTRARSGVSWYTPASSAVSKPISTLGLAQRGTLANTRSRILGLSLEAQPPALTRAVSLSIWAASSINYYNSGDATHVCVLCFSAAGAGADAGFPGAANRPAAEESFPRGRTFRVDPGPSGRHAGRDRVPARLPALRRDSGQLPHHLDGDGARREEGLGVLPPDRAGNSLAASGAGVSRRDAGHRGRPEGARRQAGHLGRGGHERLAGAAVLRQVAGEGQARHHVFRQRGGPLQRLRSEEHPS